MIFNKTENVVYIYDKNSGNHCWSFFLSKKIRDIKFIQGIPSALNEDSLLPVTKTNELMIDDFASMQSDF